MNAPSAKTAADGLLTPVQFLKGVGPQRAELLARLGLKTARDVLFFFPRDHQDLTDLRAIADLEEDRLLSVRGIVEEVELRSTGTGRSLLGVLVRQDRHYLRAIWFNQPFLRDKFARGQHVLLSGKASFEGMRWEMAHPRYELLDPQEEAPQGKLLPVYPLTQGLSQGQLRNIVNGVLEAYAGLLEEVFPESFLTERQLSPIEQALRELHFPASRPALEQARRRLVYQELLVLQLALALRREQAIIGHAPALEATARINSRIRRLLPFEFTPGQEQAVTEIAADLVRTRPMNRLLQGEVGAGKTIVALYAVLLAVAHGQQAALMAPTELLAAQHLRTLGGLLQASQVRVAGLTGGLTEAERRETLSKISAGEVDVVIGTHAILHAEAQFPKLGLVVIDEQQKFGVRQRAQLRGSGPAPHYLVMSATPIPRTVALAMYGDLDVSTIRDQPPGRQKAYTYLPGETERAKWWEFVRKKLREGRQAYVVVPRVSRSEPISQAPANEDGEGAEEAPPAASVADLETTFEELANGELADFRLDLAHGRLSPEEKEAAMQAFRRGDTQVLVATSVVEVGIDVPNATLMTILDAQRFGLAQLHQLRGRIRRGVHAGYCCLLADLDDPAAVERLQAVVDTDDGFALAETDLKLRGPGDLFGSRQHGLPPLRIADLSRDAATLEEARRDAQALVASDPGLAKDEHARLRRMVLVRYGAALGLGDVG